MVEGSILGSLSEFSTTSANVSGEERPMAEFAKSLRELKLDLSSVDLFDMVQAFSDTATSEMLIADKEDTSDEIITNWTLEANFWRLVETLVRFRYSQHPPSDLKLSQFTDLTSRKLLQEWILSQKPELRELWFVMVWLTDSVRLNHLDDEDNVELDQLQPSKWLSTKAELQANKPRFVKNLDLDAPIRQQSRISESDVAADQKFFKKVFHLLLEKDDESLEKVAELTNNWTFSMIMAGTMDYCDPLIDGSFLSGDDSMDMDSKPFGIKNSLAWRRAVYNLSQQKSLNNYERAAYEFLCGEVEVSAKLTNSWEKQLLLYLNNIFKCEMECELVKLLKLKQPNAEDLDIVDSLRVPSKSFPSLSDVLNFLAASGNEAVKLQSEHPVRVLEGSILTNSIASIMESSIELINETLSGAENSLLTTTPYLLRIVVHFALFMKLLDNGVLDDAEFTKMLRLYITRLSLYKLFEEIPLYVSFIPREEDKIDSYSFFLSNMIVEPEKRAAQLTAMRDLGLPLEDILRRTVNRVFEDTKVHYSSYDQIVLQKDEESATKIDIKLFSSVLWFIEEKMWTDAVEATLVIMRRFLTRGKVGSLLKFHKLIGLDNLIEGYELHHSLILTHYAQNGEKTVSRARLLEKHQIEEIKQNLLFIETFDTINKGEKALQAARTDRDRLSLFRDFSEVDLSVRERAISWYDDLINGTYESPKEDIQLYCDLRVMYVPFMIETLFEALTTSKSIDYMRQGVELVNLVSDDAYGLDELFVSAGKLESFLGKLATVSISAFENSETGIYV